MGERKQRRRNAENGAYLAGNTSGDDNNLDTLKRLVELVCGISSNL
jgi:hypothetical protein